MRAERVFYSAVPAEREVLDPVGYRFGEIGIGDLSKGDIFQERDRPKLFPLRMQRGHRCFVWTDTTGTIVGYLWLTNAQDLRAPWVFNLVLGLLPGQAYVWDCRIAVSHSGRGLYTAGLIHLLKQASELDIRAVLIDSDPNNRASIRAIQKAGFKRVTDVQVRRAGPVHLIRQRDRWHISKRYVECDEKMGIR